MRCDYPSLCCGLKWTEVLVDLDPVGWSRRVGFHYQQCRDAQTQDRPAYVLTVTLEELGSTVECLWDQVT